MPENPMEDLPLMLQKSQGQPQNLVNNGISGCHQQYLQQTGLQRLALGTTAQVWWEATIRPTNLLRLLSVCMKSVSQTLRIFLHVSSCQGVIKQQQTAGRFMSFVLKLQIFCVFNFCFLFLPFGSTANILWAVGCTQLLAPALPALFLVTFL